MMKSNMGMNLEDMIKMRNQALFSFDREAICQWILLCGERIPENEEVFWGGVCKAICNITDAPQEVVDEAKSWLYLHNMSYRLNGILGG